MTIKYILRISTSSIYAQESSRITGIQIQSNREGFSTLSFNIWQIAEIEFRNTPFDQLTDPQLDVVELKLLKSFQTKVKPFLIQNSKWYHWGMDDGSRFGFGLLEHRWDILTHNTGKRVKLRLPHSENRVDLKELALDKLGSTIPHLSDQGKSLFLLADYFGLSKENLLTGEEEADCFGAGSWKDIANSGDSKIKLIKLLISKIEAFVTSNSAITVESSKGIFGRIWDWVLKWKDHAAFLNHTSALAERFGLLKWGARLAEGFWRLVIVGIAKLIFFFLAKLVA